MLTILCTTIQVHYCSTDCAVEGECESCCGTFNFEDKEFTVKRGDYAPLMEKVCLNLKAAEVRKQGIQCAYSPVCNILKPWDHFGLKIIFPDIVPLFLLNEYLASNSYLFLNNCHRATLPMRTRKRCLKSTDAASPLAQLRPIKRDRATGSKTRDQLLRGEASGPHWHPLNRLTVSHEAVPALF